MRFRSRPTVDQLSIPKAGRFVVLPKALSKAAVRALFDEVLDETDAKRVTEEVRVAQGAGNDRYVHSFLCFRTNPKVKFLSSGGLEEIRYGFVLLIERRGHLAVFHRLAAGLDGPVANKSRPVDRRRLTHIWSDRARYQKLATRRMTIARQELRGASYEADDLETALVPAMAARSILQSIRLATARHGTVGVTPSTGRIRVSAGRANLIELVGFIDDTLNAIESQRDSSFLNAFPEPVELEQLPPDVEPTGMLFDFGELHDLLDDPTNGYILKEATGEDPHIMLETLSAVMKLRKADDGWEGVDDAETVVAQVRRLKHSYTVQAKIAKSCSIETPDGSEVPLDRWLRERAAFRLSFTSPEFFYSDNRLFRKAGFAQEVAQVQRFLESHAALDAAESEKGDDYLPAATSFAGNSIFGILETSLAATDRYLWCCDLGDEWADYIGVGANGVTFYHCKHGLLTRGATAFQIVTAQALKNLARIKFRREDVQAKIVASRQRQHWGRTRIPLLARGGGGWPALEESLLAAVAEPTTRWRVTLVVTALSLTEYQAEARRADPTPHFIQLVWLLSAFVSACRERDAQPMIYCRS